MNSYNLPGTAQDCPFGLVIPGRPIITSWHPLSETKYINVIPNPGQVHELSLFLIPRPELPNTDALYYSIPPFTQWILVGAINFNSPSAIFSTGWATNTDVVNAQYIQVGISLEEYNMMYLLINSIPPSNYDLAFAAVRTENGLIKIARDLYNYLSSFAQATPMGERLVVPVNIIDLWIQRIKTKLEKDPSSFT